MKLGILHFAEVNLTMPRQRHGQYRNWNRQHRYRHNHATEHRAQIMAILTQLGVEPRDLSGWAYFEEGEGARADGDSP